MISVLHAGLLDGRLTLWAERSPDPVPTAAARRGRRPKRPRADPHPFAASRTELAAALESAGFAMKARQRKAARVTAWLPSVADLPLPSSPLVMEAPRSRRKPAIAAWTVPGLHLLGNAAVDLLCQCGGQTTLAPGVAIGADLAYWSRALRLAGSLVARQRFLPGLTLEEGQGRAVWEPVPSADEIQAMSRLAGSAPAASRALSSASATEPPATPARDQLASFVAAMVDHLVRASFNGDARTRKTFDSIHDHWLHALRSSDGRIDRSPQELAALAEQVRAWREPLAASAASPYRLCFRLEEPAVEEERPAPKRRKQDGNGWSVRYLLQAADDPSLLVPAAEAWTARGRKAAAIERGGLEPKRFLLAALGQASGICPRVEESLRTRTPGGYQLDTRGAHEFLTERSLLLEQAGFGVMLPAWWSRKGTKQRLSVRANVKSPKLKGKSGLSLDSVLAFDWQVALGGETLTLAELEQLARLKAPLVKVRGQWVEMTAEDINAAIEVWKKRASGKATVRDVIQMALGASRADSRLDVEAVAAGGRVGELLDRLEGRRALEEQVAPRSFSGTLRPYQLRGYSWLAFLRELGLGACLADDMGLGKTVQSLALLQRDRELGEKRPVLLVCPTSVVSNWRKEAARFTPELPVMIHHGIGRKKGAAFATKARKHALVISSYALLYRDLEHLQPVPWAGVILDEAQNVKNPETRQARAARALEADYRLALTGTPVENNVGDLWSIMEFLNSGLLGSQASFRKRFFLPIQGGGDPEAAERLKRITGPFVLRRLKTDRTIIDDLPDKLEMKVYCSLTKEQASLYRAVADEAEEALDDAEGIRRKGVVLATLSKLKQVCNHPAQFLGDGSAVAGRSGKLARLTEMLDEVVSVGDHALVFTQFAEMGELLKGHLQETFGREVPFLHGGVTRKRREEMVERFQSESGPPLFLLSLKAGGTGLNLTRANHVFHFDRWWNPAVEDQATDRAFRIGQTRDVQVHKLVCAGTLEEVIDEMIERKKQVAASVVSTGEGWLTELSNDELRRVFALRAEAIGD